MQWAASLRERFWLSCATTDSLILGWKDVSSLLQTLVAVSLNIANDMGGRAFECNLLELFDELSKLYGHNTLSEAIEIRSRLSAMTP